MIVSKSAKMLAMVAASATPFDLGRIFPYADTSTPSKGSLGSVSLWVALEEFAVSEDDLRSMVSVLNSKIG